MIAVYVPCKWKVKVQMLTTLQQNIAETQSEAATFIEGDWNHAWEREAWMVSLNELAVIDPGEIKGEPTFIIKSGKGIWLDRTYIPWEWADGCQQRRVVWSQTDHFGILIECHQREQEKVNTWRLNTTQLEQRDIQWMLVGAWYAMAPRMNGKSLEELDAGWIYTKSVMGAICRMFGRKKAREDRKQEKALKERIMDTTNRTNGNDESEVKWLKEQLQKFKEKREKAAQARS